MTGSFRAPVKVRVALYGFLILMIFTPFIMGAVGDDYRMRVLDSTLPYIMPALGLNIVVGLAGLLDLDYIVFYTVGVYMTALLGSPYLFNQFEWTHNLSPNRLRLIVWWVIPLEARLVALFGILLDMSVLKLCGNYLVIVTLGFGETIRIFMNNLGRPVNITNGPKGISLTKPVRTFGFDFSKRHGFFGIRSDSVYMYYYPFVILIAVVIIVCLQLQNLRIGCTWVALCENETTVKAMGINARSIKLLAFAMGTSFDDASGAMFASFQGFMLPESFVLQESIYILTVVVLGSMDHIPDAILSSILLVGSRELLRALAESVQNKLSDHVIVEVEALRQLLFGLMMVVVMLYRPSDLWPPPRKEDRPQK